MVGIKGSLGFILLWAGAAFALQPAAPSKWPREGLNSIVDDIVPSADGGFYVSGLFNSLAPENAPRIAVVHADGSIDANRFGKGFDKGVGELLPDALDATRVYVSGGFRTYNGEPVGKVVRMALNGELDRGFDTLDAFDGDVYAIAQVPDGSGDIYVGGAFSHYKGQKTPHVVRLTPKGELSDKFQTDLFKSVYQIYPLPNGKLYVIHGAPGSLVRLHAQGVIDTEFQFRSDSQKQASCLAPVPDGSGDIYVGGSFEKYEDYPSSGLVRLTAQGKRNPNFNVGKGIRNLFSCEILSADDGTQDIFVAGSFDAFNDEPYRSLVRLTKYGHASRRLAKGGLSGGKYGWGMVNALVMSPDGRKDLLVGGEFDHHGDDAIGKGLVRLKGGTGAVDSSMKVERGFNDTVSALLPLSGGDVLVAGSFSSYYTSGLTGSVVKFDRDGRLDRSFRLADELREQQLQIKAVGDGSDDLYAVSESLIRRIKPDGSVDPRFVFGDGFARASQASRISDFDVAPDGSGGLIVTGAFDSYQGVSLSMHTAKLSATGELDSAFVAEAGSGSHRIAFARDGSGDIYLQNALRQKEWLGSIAKVRANGSLDQTYPQERFIRTVSADAFFALPHADGKVYVTLPQSDGKPHLFWRLHRDGSRDLSFEPGDAPFSSPGRVQAMAAFPDGSGDLLVGGWFRAYQGRKLSGALIRVTRDGSLVENFKAEALNLVNALRIPGGPRPEILVGGQFDFYGDTPAHNLIKLDSTGKLAN